MNAILLLLLTSVLGACAVPLLAFGTAKLGLVAPFEIDAFGYLWRFHPWPVFATTRTLPPLTSIAVVGDFGLPTTAAVAVATILYLQAVTPNQQSQIASASVNYLSISASSSISLEIA